MSGRYLPCDALGDAQPPLDLFIFTFQVILQLLPLKEIRSQAEVKEEGNQ